VTVDSDREKLMRLYLLGRLSDQQTSELENEYVADENRFEEMLAVEDDLRDAYARGQLTSSDREAFEKRFLVLPEQRQKQEFAEVLHRYLLQVPPWLPVSRLESAWPSGITRLRGWPRVAVAAAVVVIFVILGLGGRWLERSRQGGQTVVTSPSSSAPPSSPAGSNESTETQIATFVLTPGLVRGSEEASRLLIPKGVNRIRLDLRFEGFGYSEYDAALKTAENKTVWSQDHIAPARTAAGSRVMVDLPGDFLAAGDYVLTLHARTSAGRFETVADYAFRVVKQ
jgi:hypothetical protein